MTVSPYLGTFMKERVAKYDPTVTSETEFVLGIDVGIASCGWGIVRFDKAEDGSGLPRAVAVDAGVRRFKASLDPKSGIQGASPAERRAMYRQMRRAKNKRVRRGRELVRLVADEGFFTPEEFRAVIEKNALASCDFLEVAASVLNDGFVPDKALWLRMLYAYLRRRGPGYENDESYNSFLSGLGMYPCQQKIAWRNKTAEERVRYSEQFEVKKKPKTTSKKTQKDQKDHFSYLSMLTSTSLEECGRSVTKAGTDSPLLEIRVTRSAVRAEIAALFASLRSRDGEAAWFSCEFESRFFEIFNRVQLTDFISKVSVDATLTKAEASLLGPVRSRTASKKSPVFERFRFFQALSNVRFVDSTAEASSSRKEDRKAREMKRLGQQDLFAAPVVSESAEMSDVQRFLRDHTKPDDSCGLLVQECEAIVSEIDARIFSGNPNFTYQDLMKIVGCPEGVGIKGVSEGKLASEFCGGSDGCFGGTVRMRQDILGPECYDQLSWEDRGFVASVLAFYRKSAEISSLLTPVVGSDLAQYLAGRMRHSVEMSGSNADVWWSGSVGHCDKVLLDLISEMISDFDAYSAKKRAGRVAAVLDGHYFLSSHSDWVGLLRRIQGMPLSPAAKRAIRQAMKTVMDVVMVRGRPDRIHVEVARSVAMGKKSALELEQAMEARQKFIKSAWGSYCDLKGITGTAKSNVDREFRKRLPLWIEQIAGEVSDLSPTKLKGLSAVCLYSGDAIPFSDILSSDLEIDHIWPRSLTWDDDKSNLVLVKRSQNQRKRNRDPITWLQCDRPGDVAAYRERIQGLVDVRYAGSSGKGKPKKKTVKAASDSAQDSKAEKLVFRRGLKKYKARRLLSPMTKQDVGGFLGRNLVDTQIVSKTVLKFLRCFYSRLDFGITTGSSDIRNERVCARTGHLTSSLRKSWGLNDLKFKDGQRYGDIHHALDALIVASATQRIMKTVIDSFQAGAVLGGYIDMSKLDYGLRARLKKIQSDGEFAREFRESVSSVLEGKMVTVTGRSVSVAAIHEETFYRNRDGEISVKKSFAAFAEDFYKGKKKSKSKSASGEEQSEPKVSDAQKRWNLMCEMMSKISQGDDYRQPRHAVAVWGLPWVCQGGDMLAGSLPLQVGREGAPREKESGFGAPVYDVVSHRDFIESYRDKLREKRRESGKSLSNQETSLQPVAKIRSLARASSKKWTAWVDSVLPRFGAYMKSLEKSGVRQDEVFVDGLMSGVSDDEWYRPVYEAIRRCLLEACMQGSLSKKVAPPVFCLEYEGENQEFQVSHVILKASCSEGEDQEDAEEGSDDSEASVIGAYTMIGSGNAKRCVAGYGSGFVAAWIFDRKQVFDFLKKMGREEVARRIGEDRASRVLGLNPKEKDLKTPFLMFRVHERDLIGSDRIWDRTRRGKTVSGRYSKDRGLVFAKVGSSGSRSELFYIPEEIADLAFVMVLRKNDFAMFSNPPAKMREKAFGFGDPSVVCLLTPVSNSDIFYLCGGGAVGSERAASGSLSSLECKRVYFESGSVFRDYGLSNRESFSVTGLSKK